MIKKIIQLEIFQVIASKIISGINPAVTHNIEKYKAIKKTVYLNSLEQNEGDYLEFGVYKGSSMSHAIRCFKKTQHLNPNQAKTRFFGFDSFNGFGKLDDSDQHPFYVDQNFKTEYINVKNRIKKAIGNWGAGFQLIKGFFDQTLVNSNYDIKKIRIAFIDSDTYGSSKLAFKFIQDKISPGTHIILDDFYSYNGDPTKGVAGAFYKFIDQNNLKFRKIFNYGMGGVVIVINQKG